MNFEGIEFFIIFRKYFRKCSENSVVTKSEECEKQNQNNQIMKNLAKPLYIQSY